MTMDFQRRAGMLSQYLCDVCDGEVPAHDPVFVHVYGDDRVVRATVQHVRCHLLHLRIETLMDAAKIARYLGSEPASQAILDQARVLLVKSRTQVA